MWYHLWYQVIPCCSCGSHVTCRTYHCAFHTLPLCLCSIPCHHHIIATSPLLHAMLTSRYYFFFQNFSIPPKIHIFKKWCLGVPTLAASPSTKITTCKLAHMAQELQMILWYLFVTYSISWKWKLFALIPICDVPITNKPKSFDLKLICNVPIYLGTSKFTFFDNLQIYVTTL